MTNDKLSHLTPKLRFPGFQDAPDWQSGRCRDIAKVLPGHGFPDKFQGNKKGQYPFYKVGDISHTIEKGQKFISDANNYIDSDVLNIIRGKPVPTGTIIFAKIGEAIRSNRRVITTKPAIIDNNTAGVKAIKAKSSDEFLFYLWSNVSLINHAGGVVPAVSKSALENVPLCYPSDLTEQQLIADCLGSLDDLIAAEGRKLDTLRQHKRGLMQQLFPQPGETVPRLRFPEFADAPHWQISTFGERCESFSGSTPDTSNRAYYGGTIPFIRSAEIGRDKTEIFLTEEGLANSAAKIVKRGDLLVALYGANSGDVALARIHGAINQAIMCLRSHDSAPYLCHYLTARKNWIIATYLQGGQGNLSGQIVLSVPLSIPHRDEQEKVANCLSTLDARIEKQAHRIDALRRHKQGLIQQLFPSPEVL